MLYPLVFIYFIIVIQLFAEETPAPSPEALTEAIHQAEELQREASKLIHKNQASKFFAHNFLESQHPQKGCPFQGLKGTIGPAKGCLKNTTPPIPQTASTATVSTGSVSTPKENADRILVFVSFSMPEGSLKGLAQDAQQHNAVLVMRGLYQDSFVKTARKLQELGVTIDINPELFEKYHISSVPAFILLKDGHPIFNLKGNVTLNFVAKEFKEFDDHLSKDQPNFRRAS